MGETTRYPLTWPPGKPRTALRQKSRFEQTLAGARDSLLKELRMLGAGGVILSTNIPLRADGLPYANAREPADPGVAVYFTRGGRDMVFACDRWDKVTDNLWAVAKTVEALRGIERWGSGDMVEAAFTGFQALPPARTEWFVRFREVFGLPASEHPDLVRRRLGELTKEHHPDRGGDQSVMSEINELYARWRQSRGM